MTQSLTGLAMARKNTTRQTDMASSLQAEVKRRRKVIMKQIKIEYTNEYGDCDELILKEVEKKPDMVRVVINYYDVDMPEGGSPDMIAGYFEKAEIIKMAKAILESEAEQLILFLADAVDEAEARLEAQNGAHS